VGVAQLKGAISKPEATRSRLRSQPGCGRPQPSTYRVDLCNAADGRLFIQPNGVVTVQAENSFSDVQRFTSLDGPRLSGDPRDAARL
jgi:hypothetical protein